MVINDVIAVLYIAIAIDYMIAILYAAVGFLAKITRREILKKERRHKIYRLSSCSATRESDRKCLVD